MISIITVFSGTPWWAWIALIYCLFVGIINLKDRVVYIYSLLILPYIFMAYSIFNIYSSYHSMVIDNGMIQFMLLIFMYSCFWALGITIGLLWTTYSITNAPKIDIINRTIVVEGSIATLILLLLFFSVKWTFGYLAACCPLIAHDYRWINFGSSLFISGLLMGRSIFYLGRYTQRVKRSQKN